MECNYSGPEAWELYKMEQDVADLKLEVAELKDLVRHLLERRTDDQN